MTPGVSYNLNPVPADTIAPQTERRRFPKAELESYEPYDIYRHLFGGISNDGRPYPGLKHRVKALIGESFKEYRPLQRTGSVIRFSTARSHERYADPKGLRNYCRDWILTFGDHRPGKHLAWLEQHPPTEPLDKAEVSALVGKTTSSARVYLDKAEKGTATAEEIEAVLGLCLAFQSFLSSPCMHSRRKHHVGYSHCPDCDHTEVA